jgi:adenylate cyclase
MHMLGLLNPCGGGDPIPLLKQKLLVGRRGSCDISLRFPNVSSHHCELELVNGYWHVRDLGSRNGIKVNGNRCESEWLMPGDVLHVAKHRYEISYTPDGAAPPPQDDVDPFALGLLEKAGLTRRNVDDLGEDDEDDEDARERYEIEQAGNTVADDDLALKWLNRTGNGRP